MPERNPLYNVALRVAERLKGMEPPKGASLPVPFGMETVSSRDLAVRTFGRHGMTRQEREKELQTVGLEEMLQRAVTYQKLMTAIDRDLKERPPPFKVGKPGG